MADQTAKGEAWGDDFYLTWSIRCFQFGQGIREQKGVGVRLPRFLVAGSTDLNMAQLGLDRGFAHAPEYPFDEAACQYQGDYAKRNCSNRNGAAAFLSHNISKCQ